MKAYFLKIIAILLVTGSTLATAQVDPSYRQNQFNALMLNPAHAGSNSFSDVSVMVLHQWMGVPGAPKTYTVSGNFNIIDNLGLGISVLGDETGPLNQIRGDVNLAYHIKLGKSWRFGLGLRGTLSNTVVKLTDLTIINPNDPYFQGDLTSGLGLNAGWGVLLSSKWFYLGVSQPSVVAVKFIDRDMTNFVPSNLGLIAYTGANINLGKKVIFRPNTVIRYLKNTPFNFDVNTIFTFVNTIDFGVTYQLNSGIGAILGVDIKKRFYIGYSYSYPLNSLSRGTFQSHELSLRFKFNNKDTKAQSPRFFMN